MATLTVSAKPAVATMRVAQISKPGSAFEIVERGIPEPDAGQVRIRVQACGICHSDVLTKMASSRAFSTPAFLGMRWQG